MSSGKGFVYNHAKVEGLKNVKLYTQCEDSYIKLFIL